MGLWVLQGAAEGTTKYNRRELHLGARFRREASQKKKKAARAAFFFECYVLIDAAAGCSPAWTLCEAAREVGSSAYSPRVVEATA